jgi:hypothetical protein
VICATVRNVLSGFTTRFQKYPQSVYLVALRPFFCFVLGGFSKSVRKARGTCRGTLVGMGFPAFRLSALKGRESVNRFQPIRRLRSRGVSGWSALRFGQGSVV